MEMSPDIRCFEKDDCEKRIRELEQEIERLRDLNNEIEASVRSRKELEEYKMQVKTDGVRIDEYKQELERYRKFLRSLINEYVTEGMIEEFESEVEK
jgi:DNA repair exonuclease SbcCD ATPase subunit